MFHWSILIRTPYSTLLYSPHNSPSRPSFLPFIDGALVCGRSFQKVPRVKSVTELCQWYGSPAALTVRWVANHESTTRECISLKMLTHSRPPSSHPTYPTLCLPPGIHKTWPKQHRCCSANQDLTSPCKIMLPNKDMMLTCALVRWYWQPTSAFNCRSYTIFPSRGAVVSRKGAFYYQSSPCIDRK